MMTVEAIANKSFRRTFLGYDLEEVDDFLDELANDLAAAQNIEAMIGTTVDTAPKAAPKHPTANDSTTSKFATLNLQFGRNYDPKTK